MEPGWREGPTPLGPAPTSYPADRSRTPRGHRVTPSPLARTADADAAVPAERHPCRVRKPRPSAHKLRKRRDTTDAMGRSYKSFPERGPSRVQTRRRATVGTGREVNPFGFRF